MSGLGLNFFRRSEPVEPAPIETNGNQPAAQRPTAPSDVPEKVQDAYGQALFLVERSPRASGALSRYCLQQIIRDFWDIDPKKQGLLAEELDLISDMIAEETRSSIQCVRDFGSIDYHFSQDRDMMVDTTIEEARMLLALVQLLFQEWYAERYKRKTRCETITRMAEIANNTYEEAIREDVLPEAEEPDGDDSADNKSDKNSDDGADNDDEPDAPKLEAVRATGS
ncbi:MAG: DUF4145 domain-containing protein [Hyphomicrobiaceae bacterium]|nr:DUF4145 domain-containing protein [Hyphomicrobiaceae bacterium]